jgi:hypothetical protein
LDTAVGAARYRAFISYSHRDAAFGRRLHRRLEGYVLPRRLVGRQTAYGEVPRRLAPIFRDRDELPAAHDLTREVQAALDASAALIVVCSPAAAASQWVSREIEVFRALHPERPILAALAAGEPSEAFPLALQKAGGAVIEPLAADFRPDGDGRSALLKLVAGVAGIGLDELIQRDAQKRIRTVTAVTVGALIVALVMALLTYLARSARDDAETQRGKAEDLAKYMLTELQPKLTGVGRLDVMSDVNARVLAHFAKDDPRRRGPQSNSLLATGWRIEGQIAEMRNQSAKAVADFRKAERLTRAALEAAPRDADRIFDQAQSVFWLGEFEYSAGRFDNGRARFEQYLSLADQLLAVAPHNGRSLREVGYAEGNLCSIDLAPPKRPVDALRLCTSALAHMKAAARTLRDTPEMRADIANREGWLSDAYRANSDTPRALAHRLIHEHMLTTLLRTDPLNKDLWSSWVYAQRGLARMEVEAGKKAQGIARLRNAFDRMEGLTRFDPENGEWAKQKAKLNRDLTKYQRRET